MTFISLTVTDSGIACQMVHLPSIYSGWKIVGNTLAHANVVLFLSANSINGIASFCFNFTVDSLCVISSSNYVCALRASCPLVVPAFDALIVASDISSGKSLSCKGAGLESFLSLNAL